MSFEETITVQWSSHLEDLADELLKSVTERPGSPFDKTCIVVNDSATENWLKQYFLQERKIPQILMNLEFVRLPEFLNDWLAALVHGTDPRRRRAAQHPYSPGVLAWRIFRILGNAAPDGELRELLHYVGPEDDPLRRYALSEKLAKLYDDYQNSRFQMLRNWETGGRDSAPDAPEWQPALYRMLTAEDPHSYARDYETAFRPETRADTALRHGFPHYRGIHVFDISFLPEPMLRMLEKISEAIPMHVWCFNPQSEWLADTPSKRETIAGIRRELLAHRETLQAGKTPPELKLFDVSDFYDSPEERLFGTFASGARAVLWNWSLDTNTDAAGTGESIEELKGLEVSIHGNYSPRRELEAVRDGLCNFFRRNPDAGPLDAVVLCADWENYAPIIESVFGAGRDRRDVVPVTVAGGVSGDTPFTQSLKDLLEFRENRFEVGAVFNLLGVPAIRGKFGLDVQAVNVLRTMVQKANIHWGFDDADVRRILQMTPEQIEKSGRNDEDTPYPFTWRRGFDRLISEMLYGTPGDEDTILPEVGTLRDLRPCGSVEGDRAGYASALWHFVSALQELRRKLAPKTEYSAEEMESAAQWILDTFYLPEEHSVKDMIAVRKAFGGLFEAMRIAGVRSISTDVFAAAAGAAAERFLPGMRTPGNAVLFAPLNTYTATPHQLVWICGLNDGAFPKIENRPSYDLIGKHPSFFDATAREKGAFALLKAVLGARKQLSLSCVGKDVHTNEEIPPSVLLNDLQDYFEAVRIPVTICDHPMHAYSQRYFYKASDADDAKSAPLPPSSSLRDEAIARTLRNLSGRAGGTVAFPLDPKGITEIRLQDLVSFFAAPNRYLLESSGARIPESRFDNLKNKEALSAKLHTRLKRKLALLGECSGDAATLMVECGRAPDSSAAAAEIKAEIGQKAALRALTFSAKNAQYTCLNPDGSYMTFAEAYLRFLERNSAACEEESCVELEAANCTVRLKMVLSQPVELTMQERKMDAIVFYENAMNAPVKNQVWLWHLGANAVRGGIATFLFSTEGVGTLFLPLTCGEAKELLVPVLKLAAAPLPPDYPDWENLQKDVLPPDWPAELWRSDLAVNTHQKKRNS